MFSRLRVILYGLTDDSGANQQESVAGYTWIFVDRHGNPVPTSLLAKTAKETEDGNLLLKEVRPLAIKEGIRGACRVAVQRGDGRLQYYQSKWFTFRAVKETPGEPGVIPGEKGSFDK